MFSRTLYAWHPVITKDLPISLRFSLTIFYRDANSVLLRAHLCTAVGSMRRTLSVFEVVHQDTVKKVDSTQHVVVKTSIDGGVFVQLA